MKIYLQIAAFVSTFGSTLSFNLSEEIPSAQVLCFFAPLALTG
jgi:hypothetical protein